MEIRKIVKIVEEIHREMGKPWIPPLGEPQWPL